MASVAVLCVALALPGLAVACTVSATPLRFGVYNFRAVAPLDAHADLRIACPEGILFQVALQRPGGGALQLLPLGGGRPLRYELYVDAARTRVWGDGTGRTEVRGGAGTSAPVLLQVYGRIPPGQAVSAGEYRDQITVTVNW